MSGPAALQVESRSIGSGPLRVLDGDAMLPVRALRSDTVTCVDMHSDLPIQLTAAQGNTIFRCAKRASYLGDAYIWLPSAADMVGLTFRFELDARHTSGNIYVYTQDGDFSAGVIAQTTTYSSTGTTNVYATMPVATLVNNWVEFRGLASGYNCVYGVSIDNGIFFSDFN